jgi:endonuclease/exonuclease/phosphatase family metal-dependent hydrolase
MTGLLRPALRTYARRMGYDIEAPYGPRIETTVRVATWNVWARYGPWEARETAIVSELAGCDADLLVLVEAWETADDSQAERLKAKLGLPHSAFREAGTDRDFRSGTAILSRWPIVRTGGRRLGEREGWDAGQALHTRIAGPRGEIDLFGVMLGWRLNHSAERQRQVRDLAAYVREVADSSLAVVLCGDFNADADSDEIRMLTGRTSVAAPGLVFYDAWEMAGDGSKGHTWVNTNPWAAPVLFPERRLDYVFSAWPRKGGVGHPVRCELLGTEASDGVYASDHYGVLAELRY